MLFSLFLCHSLGRTYSFTDLNITSLILNDGDTVVIDGYTKKLFLTTSPHYFSGKLTINTTCFDLTKEIEAQASERYVFVDSLITIKYSKASGPCKIELFLLEDYVCGHDSLYIRGARSSRIFDKKFGLLDTTMCYFYSFEENPVGEFEYHTVSPPYLRLLYQLENRTFYDVDLNQISKETLEKRFVISAQIGNMSNYELNFRTNLTYGDWTEEDSYFECWPPHLCSTEPHPKFHVTSDRSVEWWIWTALFGSVSLVFVALIICMLSKPKDDGYGGSFIQPLISLQPK